MKHGRECQCNLCATHRRWLDKRLRQLTWLGELEELFQRSVSVSNRGLTVLLP